MCAGGCAGGLAGAGPGPPASAARGPPKGSVRSGAPAGGLHPPEPSALPPSGAPAEAGATLWFPQTAEEVLFAAPAMDADWTELHVGIRMHDGLRGIIFSDNRHQSLYCRS